MLVCVWCWVVPGVGLCQVLGCGRCWVVPGAGWCQAYGARVGLGCTRYWVVQGKTRVPPRTTPTTTAAATTKQLATVHSTGAHKLTVNTTLLLRELLATAALYVGYRLYIVKFVHNGSYARSPASGRAFPVVTMPSKYALCTNCVLY